MGFIWDLYALEGIGWGYGVTREGQACLAGGVRGPIAGESGSGVSGVTSWLGQVPENRRDAMDAEKRTRERGLSAITVQSGFLKWRRAVSGKARVPLAPRGGRSRSRRLPGAG